MPPPDQDKVLVAGRGSKTGWIGGITAREVRRGGRRWKCHEIHLMVLIS